MTRLVLSLDDLGYAVLVSVDYVHNVETDAKQFFSSLYSSMAAKGFSFDNRIFYKIGTREQVEQALKLVIAEVKTATKSDPKNFLRSVHLVPLSQFLDLTPELVAAAAAI